MNENQEKLIELVNTLKKSGLAASDADAYEMAKKMLNIKDLGKGSLRQDS
jgi:hypothetical protein